MLQFYCLDIKNSEKGAFLLAQPNWFSVVLIFCISHVAFQLGKNGHITLSGSNSIFTKVKLKRVIFEKVATHYAKTHELSKRSCLNFSLVICCLVFTSEILLAVFSLCIILGFTRAVQHSCSDKKDAMFEM